MTAEPSPSSTNNSTGPNIVKGLTIDQALLESCIHCGLCLPACPTYLATGRESESPRGRIYLLTLASRGELPVNENLTEHIDSCLGCMGCQTACPSGVHYEDILTSARSQLASLRPTKMRRILRLVFSKILPDYPRLRRMGALMRLWQKSPFKGFFRPKADGRTGLWQKLSEWHELMPEVPPFKELPKQAWQAGEKKGEAQLFAGCVMDIFYNHVNHACVRLLTKQKLVVRVPEQTCCGALAAHSGELDIARKLAKENIDLFSQTTGDIVVTGAGCGAMLKEYGKLLADDKEYSESAKDFSARVVDITEKLAAGEFSSKPKPLAYKVAYHAACHLSHVQKVRYAPKQLLENLPVQLVQLEDAEHCCGSAGIYNIIHTELSLKVLQGKMDNIADTGAQVVVTTNPGCQLQLTYGAKQLNSKVRIQHLAELLDEAYSND